MEIHSADTPLSFLAAEAFAVRGQTVVLTGAAGLIGSTIARCFAANGARLVLSDIPGERLDRRARELAESGADARAIPADLSVAADLERLATEAVAALGRVDSLINCGAIPSSPPIEQDTADSFARLCAVNVRGPWWLTRCLIDPMRRQGGGAVVNIASINGHRAVMPGSAYAATKAAVLAMTRELGTELAPHGIRVNSVSPGLIFRGSQESDWVNRLLREPYCGRFAERATAMYGRNARLSQPVARIGEPLDVALACLYLCSPAARFITGADLVVDGGRLQEIPDYEPRFARRHSDPEWQALKAELRALPEDAWIRKPRWL